jgi:hypothetical protein
MNQRAKELAERLTTFNNDMISCVENCSDEDWQKVTSAEQWPVGVVARHVAAGHYGALEFAKMIVAGETLPELTMDTLDQNNAKHAEEHVNCTKSEVLGLLKQNGSSFTSFVAELDDEKLDRTGHLELAGGEISTQQLIEFVILQSGGEHLSNMKGV